MSLVSMIGPRPNLLGHHAGNALPAGGGAADPDQRRSGEDPRDLLAGGRCVPHPDDRRHLAGQRGRGRHGAGGRSHLPRGDRCGAGRLQHPDPVGSRGVAPTRIPIPALLATAAVHHHLIRQRAAHQHRPGGRDRRGARGAPFLRAGRLWRGGDQSVSGVRDAGADPRAERPDAEAVRGAEELPQGDRQGHPEGDVQDGHLHLPVLLRRADLRRGRAVAAFVEKCFTGTASTIEGVGFEEIAREAVQRHQQRLWRQPAVRRTCSMPAATTRSACAARTMPGRRTRWPSCSTRCAATRAPSSRAFTDTINDQSERLLTLRGLMELKFADTPMPLDEVEPAAAIVQALRHRRDELRLDLARGAHHAGDRDEPHRRQVEHRRGRRGIRSLQAAAERRFDALGDQAGRVGPVRRHHRVSGECRRPADQDGAGREAGRGRPVARPQGGQEHRPRAAIRRRASG